MEFLPDAAPGATAMPVPTQRDTWPTTTAHMLSCGELADDSLQTIAQRYGAHIQMVPSEQPIPGSHWGDSEAGLIRNTLYVRRDTPLHSALHELCHYICMDASRRAALHTDAGGTFLEESAVCYLQILLADHVTRFGRRRSFQDMDAWGYSFRLGSTQAWFETDAEDARAWLKKNRLLADDDSISWRIRV